MGGENSSSRGLKTVIQYKQAQWNCKTAGEKKGRESQNEIPTIQEHKRNTDLSLHFLI